MLARLLAIAACFVLGCGSHGEKGDACRAQLDCNAQLQCVGPDDPPVCGVGVLHECGTSADCQPGLSCHAVEDFCSPTGIGSMCGPPCTAQSCNLGFRCNAAMACEPVPCDEAFTCPTFQRCDTTKAHDTSGPVYDHTHGCVNVDCTTDHDCQGTEACVNGFCQTNIGICQPRVAVP